MRKFLENNKIFYHGTCNEFEIFRPLSHFGSLDSAKCIIKKPSKKCEDLSSTPDFTQITVGNYENEQTIHSYIIPVRLNLNNTYELQDIELDHSIKGYSERFLYNIFDKLKYPLKVEGESINDTHDRLKSSKISPIFDFIFNNPMDIRYDDVMYELSLDNMYTPDKYEKTNRYHLCLQRMIHYYESINYDGFHYINFHESKGDICFVPFRPESIVRMDMSQKLRTVKTPEYEYLNQIRQKFLMTTSKRNLTDNEIVSLIFSHIYYSELNSYKKSSGK